MSHIESLFRHVLTDALLFSPTSSVAPPLTEKQIINDTSIAAVTLSNGDRRLFFQDLSGAIRQAFYSPATRVWRADINYVVASDARNHTPIAVVDAPDSWDNVSRVVHDGGVSALI